MGVSVLHLHKVGSGCPDLLVSYGKSTTSHGRTILIEVKDGSKPPSAQKLTPLEQKFFDEWQGEAYVIHSVDEAVELINTIRKIQCS